MSDKNKIRKVWLGRDSRERAVDCSEESERNKMCGQWDIVAILKSSKNVNVWTEATFHKTNSIFSLI